MFKNFFKSAIRNFSKNKLTSAINLMGLSIGISAAIIVFLIIQYDYSFDTYEPGRNNIYRIVQENKERKLAISPEPLAESLRNDFSGIEAVAPINEYSYWNNMVIVPQNDQRTIHIFHKQEHVVFVDGNYFRIFPQQWLAGDTASLKQPYNVVLSESNAQLYFPNIPPEKILGRTVIFGDTLSTIVSGVVKDLQSNSDFKYKSFISLPTIAAEESLKTQFSWGDWSSSSTSLMIKLNSGTNAEKINKSLSVLISSLPKDAIMSGDRYYLQPLRDVHTNKEFGGTIDISVLRNLSLLVVFLLLLGAINFINLSTAQSGLRAKEIGIRKTLGSSKKLLVLQYVSETFLLTTLAAVISLLIMPLLMRSFSGFIPEGLKFNFLFKEPQVLVFLLLLIFVVSVLAGLYPAFILAKLRPALVLKSQPFLNSGITRTLWLRKTLIVFQFVIAQVFLIAMLVVHKQVHYSMQKDMGVRKNAIIYFQMPRRLYGHLNMNVKDSYIKNQLQSLPGVQEAGLGSVPPVWDISASTPIVAHDNNQKYMVDERYGDTGYLKIYNIKLIAGKNVSTCNTPCEALINETLAKQLGYFQPETALGHKISMNGWWVKIVGVTKDFNLASVRTAIRPFVFYSDKYAHTMHVALQPNPDTWRTTIAKIEGVCKKIYPDWDFDYTFFDKSIENLYKEDEQLSLLLDWSAGVAIFISCLGLLGLVIFMANSRTKEIGIRKVLGSTIIGIVLLLSKDFMRLLLISIVIALPIAWWQTHNWLQNFAYHTHLSWWVFALSGILMIIIALTILSIKIVNVARANPVRSLRSE